jgi:hypothetical protein
MPSQELATTIPDRTAWNTLNGVETAHHDSLLTAEQAQRINETFAVKLVTGVHGVDAGTAPGNSFLSPYQKTYEAAKNAVDTLQPGDVLLLEAYEHSAPLASAKAEASPKEYPPELNHMLAALDGLKEVVLGGVAERMRDNRAISTWSYAEMLAQSRGIEVVSADMDKYDKESFDAAVGGEVVEADSTAAQSELERIRQLRHARRETKAVNTTKDWMLAHLEDPKTDGRKRTVMLMFGAAHKENLEQEFANLGIEIESELLDGGLQGHVRNMVTETIPPLAPVLAKAIKPSLQSGWAQKRAAQARSNLTRRQTPPTNE